MTRMLQREVDQIKLNEKLPLFPWYVAIFINHKEGTLSPSSLLGYLSDYEIFFNWLISEKLTTVALMKDIPLSELENLSIDDATNFPRFLKRTTKFKKGNNDSTVNRKLSSLKSLFNYLQNKAEDSEKRPLLQRNVMAKIDLNRLSQDIETKAAIIEHKILSNEEQIEDFRNFVAGGYSKTPGLSTKQLSWYEDNKERDLAIVSIILSSGLRVSEVISISLDSFDWDNRRVLIRRKGNKEQSLPFSERARSDLRAYLEVRSSRYKPGSNENTYFLTKGGRPISKNAVQKMIMRYADYYGKPLTVHKLRHTFATRFYREEKDHLQLQKLLGHSDPKTTVIYTHVGQKALDEAIDRVDK